MDVREKLVELLHKGVRCPGVIDNCNDCPHHSLEKPCDEFGATVDMLIANGVTVQEWIPVTERLPDENGLYLVVACDDGCTYGEGIWYDTVVVLAEYYKGCWSWNEGSTEYDLTGIVTHWMLLPEPPKEEQNET